MDILLIIDSLVSYSKNDIDKGNTPQKIYEICGCIREHFCLSYNIRKNNNLYLYFLKEDFSIKLIGDELRYLGPDERSQALLLNKAIKNGKISSQIQDKYWRNSTPGIYTKKFENFNQIIEELSNLLRSSFQLVINKKGKFQKIISMDFVELTKENMNLNAPIIIFLDENYPFSIDIENLQESHNLKILYISKIRNAVNKILFVNFLLEN